MSDYAPSRTIDLRIKNGRLQRRDRYNVLVGTSPNGTPLYGDRWTRWEYVPEVREDARAQMDNGVPAPPADHLELLSEIDGLLLEWDPTKWTHASLAGQLLRRCREALSR